MLKIFRTNQLFVHLLVLVYLAILWIPAYLVTPVAPAGKGGFVYDWFLGILPPGQNWTLTIAILLIWIQGLVMSFLMNEYRIGPQASLFPGLFIALLYSASPEFYGLSPQLLANTFLVLAIQQLYKIYKQTDSVRPIFNAGLLIGLATLTFQGYLLFALLGWIGIGILKSRKVKEALQYIIGLLLPWGLLWAMDYLLEPPGTFAELAGLSWGWPPFFYGPEGLRMVVQLLVLMVLVVAVVLQYNRVTLGETMQVQKNIQILYWAALLALGSLLIIQQIEFTQFLMVVVPTGALLGLWMVRLRPSQAEMSHFLLFMAAFIYQYFPLMYL
ncbi:MAG: hypothetical protein K9I85_14740 [Saprospiraceae bacterium]|nr:hypothetical protein [Saprospiraceae bacterium]